jgi:hypothetical protein
MSTAPATPSAPASAGTGPVDRFLAAVTGATIGACDAWADDVVLDATVPGWRLAARGPDAVRDEYGRWFAHPGRMEELRRIPHAGGEVVAYLLAWEQDGVPHAAHYAHVLDVVDGRIVADTVWCGGRWPASLLAEMEAARG